MVQMNANELADAMEIRASIRRKAVSRKSVQENANDRLADQLDEAATMLRQQQADIEALKLASIQTIGTLKWSEDLLREAGHTEAVSDIQDCIVAIRLALRKAQEK